MSDDERRAGSQRLYAAFVVLVGASAGLMALSGGATLMEVLIVVLAGLVIGTCLIAYLLRIAA